MTAIQTVPAGVARILTGRAACLAEELQRRREVCHQVYLCDRLNITKLDAYNRASVSLRNAPSAEKLAQEWLDGLARMELAPMEGAL